VPTKAAINNTYNFILKTYEHLNTLDQGEKSKTSEGKLSFLQKLKWKGRSSRMRTKWARRGPLWLVNLLIFNDLRVDLSWRTRIAKRKALGNARREWQRILQNSKRFWHVVCWFAKPYVSISEMSGLLNINRISQLTVEW
jgi:hypothetical protein